MSWAKDLEKGFMKHYRFECSNCGRSHNSKSSPSKHSRCPHCNAVVPKSPSMASLINEEIGVQRTHGEEPRVLRVIL